MSAFVIAVVFVSLSSGCSSTSNSSSGSSQKEEPSAVGINQPATVGDAEWTVTDARHTNQLTQTEFGQVGKSKQGTFIIVDFNFTNKGNDRKTLHTGALQLVDASGRTSDPDTDTFGYIPQDKNIFLTQVNPGVTQPGEVIFSVAPDGSGYKLLLRTPTS